MGKIVYLCPYYGQIGGMQKVAQVLHERSGTESLMITCGSTIKGQGIINLRSFRLFSSPICLMLLPTLLRVIKTQDIIHVHVAQAFFPEMVWLFSKITRHPYIVHFHIDVIRSGLFGIMINLYKRSILRKVLSDSAKIIVPTNAYKRLVSETYGINKQNISVIPNGIDINGFKMSRKKGNRFLFVGRLAHQKNISLLLDGFRSFQQEYDRRLEYELAIVGSGELELDLKEKVRQEKIDNVSFRGEKRGKELAEEYANADYFIMTSHVESFGIVCVEAMAAGLPMVLVDLPELREVTSGNAVFVDKSAESLCDGIRQVVSDKMLCSRLSRNGLLKARNFDWSRIIKRYQQVHQRFTPCSPAPSAPISDSAPQADDGGA